MVTIEELEKKLYASEKIAIACKAKYDELGEMEHPELNKIYCALKLILEGNGAD